MKQAATITKVPRVYTFLPLFAHAGETHETTTEAVGHSLISEWYIAVPLFVVFMFGVGGLTYVLSRKSTAITMGVVLGVLFACGVGLYQVSPAVSVLALSSGFGLTLVQVISGLGKPPAKKT